MSIGRHLTVLKESVAIDRDDAKTRKHHLETDFLPAALEILESPPNPLGRLILKLLVAFVVIALVWAFLGKVEIVASAQGRVAPAGRIKTIQAADMGVVRAIHVRDGQAVKKGDPLIALDPTISEADREQARQALDAALVDLARTRAIVAALEGKPTGIAAPEGTGPEQLALQQRLINARLAEHEGAVGALKKDVEQRRSDLRVADAEVAKLSAQAPLAETQLAGMQKLADKGLAPKLRVAELEERVIGVRQDLIIRREEARKARAALASAQAQLARTDNEFMREDLDALAEAEANASLRAEELKKADEKSSLMLLTAPEDGIVAQLQVTTLGGVVKPADPLLIIVPKGQDFVIEAMVLNKDAGFVREGQAVEVKMEAFPFTRYGVLKGVVQHISRDSIQDEKQGLVFPARVTLKQIALKTERGSTPVSPGMAATAEIKTGERTIISYLLSPLQRRVQEAGRER